MPEPFDALPDPTNLAAIRAFLRDQDPAGRLHAVGIREILIASDALDRLPSVVERLARPGPVVVLGDPTPIQRAGEDLKALVAARLSAVHETRRTTIGTGRSEVHADDRAIAETAAAIGGAGCVVCVGSGTMTDIAKAATHELGDVPLVVVQTAVSVNAFSDDMAVLVKNGVKRTVPSRWADALLIDLLVIADAPVGMNRAGFGELAAMFTAPADWYLAGALGMDSAWHPAPVELFRREGEELLAAADGVRAGDPGALALLARLMTLSGMALGVAGRTAPISGAEHIVSHMLDMDAEAAGRPLAFHGAQVGVASVIMALAWAETLEAFDPSRISVDAFAPDPAGVRAAVQAAFEHLDAVGAVAAECWRDVERKLERMRAARPAIERFLADWPRHRAALRELTVDPDVLATALGRAGAPTRFRDLEPAVQAALARWALSNCHLMRDRFVLADLRALTGTWAASDIDRLLARAASLGAGL